METVKMERLLEQVDAEIRPAILGAIERTGASHAALYECHMMDSSAMGEKFVLCVGPTCTYTTPETLPLIMSRRGLASDQSSLMMVAPVEPGA